MAWVALFVFVGKLAGAAKEMAIAYRYGLSREVDAYLFVFNLVSWPIGVWFSILTVVLVPLAARMRQTDPSELPRFRSELLGFVILLGLALALAGWSGLPLCSIRRGQGFRLPRRPLPLIWPRGWPYWRHSGSSSACFPPGCWQRDATPTPFLKAHLRW